MSNPKISVVIGTYNQKDVLNKVLESFNQQTLERDKFEVIVVDSTSSDGTREMLHEFQADFQFYFFIQENSGKTGARNRGVDEARGEYIFITDADMIAHPELLERHLLAHQKTTVETCFEGNTLNMEKLEWPAAKESLHPYITRNLKDGAALGWYYFLTGNISFPKNLYLREGGLSQDFLGYGWEDLEFGYRLSKKKVPLYYLKQAINYHYHVITKEEEIERNIKKGESARIFLKKHPELKWFLGLNPVSKFVFPKIDQAGTFYKMMKENFFMSKSKVKHEIGFWFLKEFNYLRGLLGSQK